MEERGHPHRDIVGEVIAAILALCVTLLINGMEHVLHIPESGKSVFELILAITGIVACVASIFYIIKQKGKLLGALVIIGIVVMLGLVTGLILSGAIPVSLHFPAETPVLSTISLGVATLSPSTPPTIPFGTATTPSGLAHTPTITLPPSPSPARVSWLQIRSGTYMGQQVIWALGFESSAEQMLLYYFDPFNSQWQRPGTRIPEDTGLEMVLFADPDFEGVFTEIRKGAEKYYGWVGEGEAQILPSGCGGANQLTWAGRLGQRALFAYRDGLWYYDMKSYQCGGLAHFYNNGAESSVLAYGVDIGDIASGGACVIAMDYTSARAGLYWSEGGKDWTRVAVFEPHEPHQAIGLWCRDRNAWWVFWDDGSWNRSGEGGNTSMGIHPFCKAVIDSNGTHAVILTNEGRAFLYPTTNEGMKSPITPCNLKDIALMDGDPSEGQPKLYLLCGDGLLYQCNWPRGWEKLECAQLSNSPPQR
jgi:hypothetical protein